MVDLQFTRKISEFNQQHNESVKECTFVLQEYGSKIDYYKMKLIPFLNYTADKYVVDFSSVPSLIDADIAKLYTYKEKAKNCTENRHDTTKESHVVLCLQKVSKLICK